MKVRIDGRELRVVRSTRVLAEWQRQSGKTMSWLGTDEGQIYSLAYMAFCALQNAGFEPKWDDILDIDTGDWEFIKEPGDDRVEPQATTDPLSPPAGSGQVDAAAGATSTAASAG